MSIITTRLVVLVLNRPTIVQSLRSEILSQLFCFLCCVVLMNYCATNMQIKQSVNVFQLTGDHNTMTDVLFGRNLRLKVCLTLWKRSVGELLTYFLRYVVCFVNVTRSIFVRISKVLLLHCLYTESKTLVWLLIFSR